MTTVTVPNIGWFSEGNFFWLDIDLWGDYNEIPVVYDEEGLNQGWGCPEEIIVNDGYKFVQYYENDNVYQKYQFGKETSEFYSLLDIEGNGYYTGLIGSPCTFSYIQFTYKGVPLLVYTAPLKFADITGYPVDVTVHGLQLPSTIAYDDTERTLRELYELWVNTEYGDISTITRTSDDPEDWAEFMFPFKFVDVTYYEGDDQYIYTWADAGMADVSQAGFEAFEELRVIIAGSVVPWADTQGQIPDVVLVNSNLGDFNIRGTEAISVELMEVGQRISHIIFTGQGTDTTYDLEDPTENYKVLGIVGNTVMIQIDDHKTVTHTYEYQVGEVTLDPSGDTLIVTATTKADPDDVTCQLYQCSADPRVVDKTNYLTNIQQLSGSWVVPFDEMSPVLRINLSNNLVTSGNYCSIYSAGWGTKYYFIKNRVCVGQEVWDLYLEEDVLMTFKSYFKPAIGLIDRSETAYNLLIPDSTIPLEVGQNVTVREIPNDVFSDNYGYNYVLTGLMVGGETK